MKLRIAHLGTTGVLFLALFGTATGHFLHPAMAQNTNTFAQDLQNPEAALKKYPSGPRRFYLLGEAAKDDANQKKWALASSRASKVLQLAPQYKKDWNYGNAIHDGNMVLGRAALVKGNKKEAIRRLLLAGKTPGSPQLNSFGPNMTLAKELLEAGEKITVLQYFELCGKFWALGKEDLATWTEDVMAGKVPDFKGNLRY